MYVEPDYKVPSKAQRKLCLIVVDMQNCFFDDDKDSRITYKGEIENIARVIKLFHENSRDVFVIKYVGETHSISKDMNLMKELGELLYFELQQNGFNVNYIIDKNAESILVPEGIPIFSPDQDLPDVDVIVVTAIHYYSDIAEYIDEKVGCPIISLEDIVYSL